MSSQVIAFLPREAALDRQSTPLIAFDEVVKWCEAMLPRFRNADTKRLLLTHFSYLKGQRSSLADALNDGDSARVSTIMNEVSGYLNQKFLPSFGKRKFQEGGYLDRIYTELITGFNHLSQSVAKESKVEGLPPELRAERAFFRQKAQKAAALSPVEELPETKPVDLSGLVSSIFRLKYVFGYRDLNTMPRDYLVNESNCVHEIGSIQTYLSSLLDEKQDVNPFMLELLFQAILDLTVTTNCTYHSYEVFIRMVFLELLPLLDRCKGQGHVFDISIAGSFASHYAHLMGLFTDSRGLVHLRSDAEYRFLHSHAPYSGLATEDPEGTHQHATSDPGIFRLAVEVAAESLSGGPLSESGPEIDAFSGDGHEEENDDEEHTDLTGTAPAGTRTPIIIMHAPSFAAPAPIPAPESAPVEPLVVEPEPISAPAPKVQATRSVPFHRTRSVLGGMALGFGLAAGQAPWTVAPIGECVDVIEASTLPDDPTSEAFVPLSVKVANQAETVEELERAVLEAHDWKEVRSAHPWIESDVALTAFTRDLENWGGWEKPLELYAKAEKNGAVFSSPSELLAFWDGSSELAQGTALRAAQELAFELRPEINPRLEDVADLHDEAASILDPAQFESDVSQDALEQAWFDEGDSMEAAAPQTAPVQNVRDRVKKFFEKLFS